MSQNIERACTASPDVAEAHSRVLRLLESIRRWEKNTPEDAQRGEALVRAHMAAVARRNELISRWEWDFSPKGGAGDGR